MARALEHYANLVQNGKIDLWRPFMKGADNVIVTVCLDGGGVRFEEGPDILGFEAEIKNLKGKLAEKDTEIKALNILLEKQKPKEIVDETANALLSPPIEEEKPKPKRKRKKK